MFRFIRVKLKKCSKSVICVRPYISVTIIMFWQRNQFGNALFDNFFANRDLVLWNALPEHNIFIRKCTNLYTFKKALRAHVMT